MTYSIDITQNILATAEPFQSLSPKALEQFSSFTQMARYRVGQPLLQREQLPAQLVLLYEGEVRLIGYEPDHQLPITLQRLQPGSLIGWISLVRRVPCEMAIAATEAIGLTIPADKFLALLDQEPTVASYFHQQPALSEVFELLGLTLQQRADRDRILSAAGVRTLQELAVAILPQTAIYNIPERNGALMGSSASAGELHSDWIWLVSDRVAVSTKHRPNNSGMNIGDPISPTTPLRQLQTAGVIRLLGIPANLLAASTTERPLLAPSLLSNAEIPYAPEQPLGLEQTQKPKAKQTKYPWVRGRGEVDGAIACFQMVAQHLGLPFRRDTIRKVLTHQSEQAGALSFLHCGAVAEMMGLQAQLANVPVPSLKRLQLPVLIRWQQSFAVLYEVTSKGVVLGVPEVGIVQRQPDELVANSRQTIGEDDGDLTANHQGLSTIDQIQVLLLQPTAHTPKQKFGLSWLLPFISRYRRVFIEVLLASFFVQLFGLANPLMTQVIIDKVLVQNSANTLQILGLFLVVIAGFEALLSSLRTYLLVDTTNRIDLALGSELINHLLRLPLRYFERRPVGELASRMGELENIRQFLTNTALSVVMDSMFSVVYIVVMVIYSPLLSLVALATLPIFVGMTTLVSPLVRRQLRTKAERNAQSQSYLVEVLSGIQTVKAQNIELRSRWQWQERYARYVSAGFKTVLTSTAANSSSQFLSKLSSLLVLWVGAYLVLQGKLTLGQLIAFRIIAGYVTSPLLRLTQLWQSFQETALSLERLGDIIDTPAEAAEDDQHNIALPAIEGNVTYENVSFRFNPSGALNLNNINLELPAGAFVGIVGMSGSGKSTLMKLLPRLYPLESGRILIDGYDISKVELYSLRRQVGIVPQDSLLFDGTVQENIALNCPDASTDAIIAAAKVAAAHDFIMSLPNGYNTRVGERGSALSGGQRQRIAIARTILQNPRLLILDEATSALDYESERQVCLNLAEAFKNRTVFFITHRLSTIRNANVILMMDHGIVVEQGTHQELMTRKGHYYCLYRQQETTGS
jgi:HlyB family type I secretion system ABC transporter